MTHILLIAPRQELIIHNIPIFDNSDVKKVESWIRIKEAEYGEIDRLILSMGTVRIMEPGEPIPVPLQAGKGLVIPADGRLY